MKDLKDLTMHDVKPISDNAQALLSVMIFGDVVSVPTVLRKS